jgi:hypothetical protein
MKTLGMGNEFKSFHGSLNTKNTKNNPAEQPQSFKVSSAQTWLYLFQYSVFLVIVIQVVSIVSRVLMEFDLNSNSSRSP